MNIKWMKTGFCSNDMKMVQGHPPIICICVQFTIDDYANELSSFVMFNRLTGALMSPVDAVDLATAAEIKRPEIPFTEAHAQKLELATRKAAAAYLPR